MVFCVLFCQTCLNNNGEEALPLYFCHHERDVDWLNWINFWKHMWCGFAVVIWWDWFIKFLLYMRYYIIMFLLLILRNIRLIVSNQKYIANWGNLNIQTFSIYLYGNLSFHWKLFKYLRMYLRWVNKSSRGICVGRFY